MYLLLLPLLTACDKQPEEQEAVLAPLPQVWGVTALEDQDPDPAVVEVYLEATGNNVVTWAEGASTQDAWAFNGLVPGPLIQARVGDTVRVVFTNNLEVETTIHWHGLRIDDEMDGVPAIQAPIQPGETFTYEFVPPDAGSYWYHPHVRTNEQVERGLYGVMTIHEVEPIVVDTERFFVLDDVSLNGEDFASFTIGHMESVHGRFGNTLLINGQNPLVETMKDQVAPDAVERWRVVNTANARTMYIDVTGASWRVVAVDGGVLEQPYTAEYLEVPIGRRFDLEVIPNGEADQVVLRNLIPDNSGGFTPYELFEGSVEGEPTGSSAPDWIAPDRAPMTIDQATQEIEVEFSVVSGSNGIAQWQINGEPWEEHQALNAIGNTPTLLRVTDDSGAAHPFHLHGQFFQVLERNGEAVDEPGWMDTVMVNSRDELVLGTYLDNPGRWMLHCHILEHAEMGMMTELIVE